ncbi:scarecrow-like protein 21 [Impatiens glandulifera]|uniref:scarecrow-like protein 21 n=1 Tax=Impatiens glandulifera TaxID=253017 RepID=UPI001FB091DE|nr:scarecrow-like protein 21 [Impatiens glandulifera]
MDTSQLFGYSVVSPADLSNSYSYSYSYSSSHPTISSATYNNKLFDSTKISFGSSPSSPFASHVDSEEFTPFSSSPDNQHSSTENLSIATPWNSSFKKNSYFHMEDYHQEDSQLFHSSGDAFFNSTTNLGYTLRQLESELMGPDCEEEAPVNNNNKRHKSMEGASFQGFPSPVNLKHLLVSCAKALSDNRSNDFDTMIRIARQSVSITGEPIQRLGAYMVEGLVARRNSSGTNIYKSLRCNNEPEGNDLLSYKQIIYEICPYLKFGYMAANGAIAEACRNEDRIHIIDFQICQGTQWTTLLQALAARPGGAPHVRITGIDDPVSNYARGGGLESIGTRLASISSKFNIPIEFNPIHVFSRDMLDVRPGEALAVNFPLKLHHIPDESVDVENPRDSLLRMVKSMNPKVVTLVEQESNTNTPPFLTRFVETLDYYLAVFESIDVALPRDRKDRINAEEHCLARDIVNVIACEGKDREERHELFGKWRLRFMMAGFKQYPLSSYVNSVIKSLLKFYSENYKVVEMDGGLLLGWKERNLVSASAWH